MFLVGLVLAGPAMFLCGLVFLLQTTTDTRGNAIGAYNNQVRAEKRANLLSSFLSCSARSTNWAWSNWLAGILS